MIEELAILTDGFTGSASHTRCFLHIVNLVAKFLIRQFDVKKGGNGVGHGDGNTTADLEPEIKELEDLALDNEEDDTGATSMDNDEGVDNEDGWVDNRAMLSDDERRDFERAIRPVKSALVKVRARKFSRAFSGC